MSKLRAINKQVIHPTASGQTTHRRSEINVLLPCMLIPANEYSNCRNTLFLGNSVFQENSLFQENSVFHEIEHWVCSGSWNTYSYCIFTMHGFLLGGKCNVILTFIFNSWVSRLFYTAISVVSGEHSKGETKTHNF